MKVCRTKNWNFPWMCFVVVKITVQLSLHVVSFPMWLVVVKRVLYNIGWIKWHSHSVQMNLRNVDSHVVLGSFALKIRKFIIDSHTIPICSIIWQAPNLRFEMMLSRYVLLAWNDPFWCWYQRRRRYTTQQKISNTHNSSGRSGSGIVCSVLLCLLLLL